MKRNIILSLGFALLLLNCGHTGDQVKKTHPISETVTSETNSATPALESGSIPFSLPDTIRINDTVSLKLTPMKQEDYLAFPNTNNFDALLDSFCHDEQNKYYYHNLTPCGWDIEKYLIATSKGLVKREKSKLAIQTTLKGKLTFEENVRDTIRSSGYKFNQYLDKAGYYLIEFHSFEACPEFFLINYHSGEKLRFSGYPFFSPDETQVLVADYDYGLGWCTNSFSWWKLVNNNWVESVNYKPNNWGIEDAKWINETTVVARIGYITNRKNPGEEKFFVRMEMVGNNNTKK